MLKLYLTVLMFSAPMPASAGSTEPVTAPAQQYPGAIELLGHTGAPPAKLSSGSEVELRKVKKSRPVKKKRSEAPAAQPGKKKLIPVHFKEEPSHKTPYTCRWALGKALEILTGRPKQQLPPPQPLQLQPAAKPKN